jgi:hypothetical protein
MMSPDDFFNAVSCECTLHVLWLSFTVLKLYALSHLSVMAIYRFLILGGVQIGSNVAD